MSQVLDDLVALLSLEAIEENLFRGRSQDLGFRQLFGGQVLASRCRRPARPSKMRGMFIRCTVTSCALGMRGCRWFIRLTGFAMAAVSAPGG